MLAHLTKKIPKANKIKIFLTMTQSPSIFFLFPIVVFTNAARSIPNFSNQAGKNINL
jgi:hypothetical protein